MKKTDLSIIILNYNTSDWLENVLTSIINYQPSTITYEVIIVDNSSTDDSVSMVKKRFSQFVLVESKENGGFAKGNNLGIAKANGRYVMLLNSDTEFTSTTDLDAMIECLDENKKVGVMTPRLELADGSLDLASHRGEPTPWAAISYFGKLEQLFPNNKLFGKYHQTWKNIDEIHEIEACSGAAMIVRASLLDEVGLLDETFFMYAEDLDWCRRFRAAGYKIIFFPHSTIIHHKYKSGRGKEERSRIEDQESKNELSTQKFLRIPGFAPATNNSQPTTNTAEHHFWETMKQYYTKHYSKNKTQTWLIHKGVDLFKFMKRKK